MSALIIKIEGGLGNQLLQYLFGQSLSRLHNKEVFFDISEYVEGRGIRRFALTELGLPGKFISCKKNLSSDCKLIHLRKIKSHGQALALSDWFILRKKIALLVERESGTLQDFTSTPSAYFSGYWVSFNYWYRPRELVAWVNDYLDRTATARAIAGGALLPHANEGCAIHVRRGDYLNPEHLAWHGVCSVEYFNASISASRSTNHLFFSDDASFIDSEFSDIPGYVNASHLIGNEIDEFLILRNYRTMVISNSTYSYLAALFSSLRFADALILTPYPWYLWGNSQPPLLPTWQRHNAMTGVNEEVDLAAANQLTVNVLLYGFSDAIELTETLKMLGAQTRRPNQITLQPRTCAQEALIMDDFIRQEFGVTPLYLQAANHNEFLCRAIQNCSADFIIFLNPAIWWHKEKLAIELRLAAEMQADIVVSRVGFSSEDEDDISLLNIDTSVRNTSTLACRTVISLLSGLGSALIKSRACHDLAPTDTIYELALSTKKFVVQDKMLARYDKAKMTVSRLTQRLENLKAVLLRLQTDERASDELQLAVQALIADLKNLVTKSGGYNL